MSTIATVEAVIQATNVAFELIGAGQIILARISEAQAARKAFGKELTVEDLSALIQAGDVKAAMAKAALAQAMANFDAS